MGGNGFDKKILIPDQNKKRENNGQKGSIEIHDAYLWKPLRCRGVDRRKTACEWGSFYRIIAAAGKRVATQYSPERHRGAAKSAVFADSVDGVLGARRHKTAGGREEGRDAALVALEQRD